jgi:sarcosine oxidase subunit alpha
MKGRPHRIAPSADKRFGRLIDRARPLDFRFDGKRLTGVTGDTLASALLANGQSVVARSFKLHRPRGIMGIGVEEPNALVSLGDGAARTPNQRATMIPLTPGLVAESQNRWPSLRHDLGGVINRFKPLLPPGFYYKTFMRPARLWPFYERLIRRSGGLGRAPQGADPDRYEHVHLAVDLLIVGGGLAGICAAEAAAAAGLTVLLAEEMPRLGGLADGYDGSVDEDFLIDWVRTRVEALAVHPNVHILTRASVAALHEHGYAWVVETLDAGPQEPRERLWKVRARETVLATGAIEKPLVFPDNDRPGVMLATSARLNLRRYAVAPGQVAVVVTAGDEGYRTALDLQAVGIEVERVVDVRLRPDGPMMHIAKAMGLRVSVGSAPVGLRTIWGGATIDSLTVANRLTIEGPATTSEIFCDCVLVSGGWSPSVQLLGHLGQRLPFDPAIGAFRPGTLPAGLQAAGAVNGVFDAAEVMEDGWIAGLEAAARLNPKKRSPWNRMVAVIDVTRDEPAEPVGMLPDKARRSDQARAFVDIHNDVTVGDLRIALGEGYSDAEHVKRYTMLGLSPDQGKTAHGNSAMILSQLTGRDAAHQPHTTFRPPWTPISLGVIAGTRRGDSFKARRRSPLEAEITASQPPVDMVGAWQRPSCYPRPGESEEDAVRREVRAVRGKVGLLDASTLGKIVVAGADAARFLDLMIATDVGTLADGQARYALFLDDGGFVIDDGMVARLPRDRFLLTTTSGNADRTLAHLERWRQVEWPALDVYLTNETERWAQILVSGPEARVLVERIAGVDALTATKRSCVEGVVGGVPTRLLRARYTGAPSFEIAVPAGNGPALWRGLMERGADLDVTPFGLQTLERLRLEAGNIAVGHETDGTVTPFDLGLGHLVSSDKRDFLGKHGLMRGDLTRAGRKQLVGLVMEETAVAPAPGSQTIETPAAHPPRRASGYVTSSGFSPTQGRAIALALIANGRARIGETTHVFHAGEARRARITGLDFATGGA